jgi:spectrin beta
MHRDTNLIMDKSADIKSRFVDNEQSSVVVLNRLRDSVKYYQFLQDCDELKEWLEFKQIQAQDESYRDTKNIHMKYLRHKGFESEIQANRNRLEQLEKQASDLFKPEQQQQQQQQTGDGDGDDGDGQQADKADEAVTTDDEATIDQKLRDEIKEEMSKRMKDLNKQWDDLQDTTKLKGEKLFDANRGILFEQSVDSIDIWIKEMERHIQFTTQKPGSHESAGGNMDLTTTNLLLDKQRDIEAELLARQKQVDELKQQAAFLKENEPDKAAEIDTKRGEIEDRFHQIVQPLEEKKKQLQQQKRMFQFLRDCDDELLWIEEKMRMARSPDVGNSLVQVNMMQRKNDTLQKEVDNHDQRVQQVCLDGENMIEERHERADEFRDKIAALCAEWQNLKQAIDERRHRLNESQQVQQYLFDCGEAEAWMGEQELYMMSDAGGTAPMLPDGVLEELQQQQQQQQQQQSVVDRDSSSKWCKDEQNAQNQLKKHTQLESEVEDHAAHIQTLGDTCRQLTANAKAQINEDGTETHVLISGHNTDALSKRQMQIDKLYAGLKDLAQERRLRLEETVKLFMLHRDIDDLEQWIADKVIVADSNELGQDFEHVELLKERFRQFAADTQQIGQERVNHVSQIANVLIDAGHADSSIIAQWNENLNSAWEDLLELIRTRTQMLQSSWELQKFFTDCKELLSHIDEKKKSIPEEVGRDAQTVAQLQRRHATFEENDLITLGGKVAQIQDEAAKLHNLYAGERAKEIRDKEQQVLAEWHNLQGLTNVRKRQLTDMNDLYKFFNMSRDLMMWMETQMRQMRNDDKPRDVSGVELLINNHQSLKAEIDARVENFTICLNLGKDLCNRHHPRANEVKDKCVQLCMQRDRISDEWTNRWELLQLMLEVYQFARDAAVAEQWLVAQEPYLLNDDLGETLDQVEQLIKKHETFEKSILAQEERFNALRKLTTLELKQGHKANQDAEHPKEEEEEEEEEAVDKIAAAVVHRPKANKTADTTNLEKSRMSLYLEEFKTIEEREKDLETIRQQEQLVKDAENQVKREQELREKEAARKREAEVLGVTKALASVGASTLQSQGSPSTHRKDGKSKHMPAIHFIYFQYYLFMYCRFVT